MKTIHILLASFSFVFMSGCDSFLDRQPISNAYADQFYQTESDFQTALTAAYHTLYTIYSPEGQSSFFGELMSDNACNESTAGNVKDFEAFYTHVGMDANSTLVLNYWNQYYESLYVINNVLERSEKASFSHREALQAEARFLRALYYFNMTRAWGDIPLVLHPVSVKEALRQGRTPQPQVYETIIQALQFGIATLPDKQHERFAGAATSDAACALLGKVYLTLNRKAEAAAVLNKLYGRFTLLPHYEDLWDLNHKNSAESIFEIQYKGGAGNPYSLYWSMFTPVDNHVLTAWGGGLNQVTDDLWNAYEQGDPRRDITIQDGYYKKNGDKVNTRFTIKWRDADAEKNGSREAADNNFIVLRYADVLLMLTEATGDATYLNEVRQRVGMPLYGTPGYPADRYPTVALACEHERLVELAMEFHRWFDLIRTGRAIEVLKNSSKHVTLTPGQLLLPIPLDVISQNPDVMTQNEAYR